MWGGAVYRVRARSAAGASPRRIDAGDHLVELPGSEPVHLPVAPEPRELPLGVAPGNSHDELHRLVVARAPLEIVEQLPVAHRLQRIEPPVGVHRPRLGLQSPGDHLVDAPVDPRIELLARQVDADLHDRERPRVPASRPLRGVGEPRLQTHLQRPHHARRIPPVDLLPIDRVERPQPLGECLHTLALQLPRQLLAHRRIGLRQVVHTLAQRLHVEPLTAHGDHAVHRGEQPLEAGERLHLVAAAVELVGHLVRSDEVVLDGRELRRRGLGRTDGHAAVDLARVGGEDRRAVVLRQTDAQVGLARAGGPDDDDEPLSHLRSCRRPRSR